MTAKKNIFNFKLFCIFFFIVLFFSLLSGKDKIRYKDGPLVFSLDIAKGFSNASTDENYTTATPFIWPKYLDIGINPLFMFKSPVYLTLGYNNFVVSNCSLSSINPEKLSCKLNLTSNGFFLKMNKQVGALLDIYGSIYFCSSRLKVSFAERKPDASQKKEFILYGTGIDFNIGRLFDIYDPSLLYFNHMKIGLNLRKSSVNFSPMGIVGDSAASVDYLSFHTPVVSLNISFFLKTRIKVQHTKKMHALSQKVSIAPQRIKAQKEPQPSPEAASGTQSRIFLPYYSTHPSRRSNKKILEMINIDLPDSLIKFPEPKIKMLGDINAEMVYNSLKNNAPTSIIIGSDSFANELVNILLGSHNAKKNISYVIPKNSIKILKEEGAIYLEINLSQFEQKWISFVKSPDFKHPELIDNLFLYLGADFFSDSLLDLFQEYVSPIVIELEKMQRVQSSESSSFKYLVFRNEFKEWNDLVDSAYSTILGNQWDNAGHLLSELKTKHCDYGFYYFLAGLYAEHQNNIEEAKAMLLKALRRVDIKYPSSGLKAPLLFKLGKFSLHENNFNDADFYFDNFLQRHFNPLSDSIMSIAVIYANKNQPDLALKYLFPYMDKKHAASPHYRMAFETSIGILYRNNLCTKALEKIQEYSAVFNTLPDSIAAIQDDCLLKAGKTESLGIVAVFNFSTKKLDEKEREKYSVLLREELKKSNRMTVFGNKSMYDVLEKAGIADTGCSSPACLNTINSQTGAQRVLTCKIDKDKKRVIATLMLYEIASNSLQKQVSDTSLLSDSSAYENCIHNSVLKLLEIKKVQTSRVSATISDSSKATTQPHEILSSFGIKVCENPSKKIGVIVCGLVPKGQAEYAGFQANDLIIKINGKAIADLNNFYRLLGLIKKGEQIVITFKRFDKTTTLNLKYQ